MRTIQIIVDYKKVIFVLPIVLVLWACQSLGMAGDQSKEEIIFFEIGKEDNSDGEFRSTGFGEYQEYKCEVRVDCLTDTFPQRLHRPPLIGDASRYADAGVQRVTIVIYLRINVIKLTDRFVGHSKPFGFNRLLARVLSVRSDGFNNVGHHLPQPIQNG